MKLSKTLTKIMLAVLLIILAATVLMITYKGLSLHSYLFALLMGIVIAALYFILAKRVRGVKHKLLYQKFGAAKTGALLTVICAVVSAVWICTVRIEPFSDYMNFWQCACDLAAGRSITDADFIALFPHTMGYASFLSPFISVFGEKLMIAPILNVLLTCISGLLIYIICLKTVSFEGAVFAYCLWIFFPSKLMLNSLSLSEPLYTSLILLFILLLIIKDEDEGEKSRLLSSVLWGMGLGIILAAINMVRPLSLILIIAFFIWMLLLRGEKCKCVSMWKTWLTISAVMLCTFFIIGNFWGSYQTKVLGEEPASIPIYNIYVGFNSKTQGQWSEDDMQLLMTYKEKAGVTASDAQNSMLPHLKERLKSDNIDFGALFSAKLLAFLGNDELGGYTYRFTRSEQFVKICMLICNIYYYAVIILALVGLLRMYKRKLTSPILVAPLYVIGLTMAHMLIEVANRYHYSAVPLIVIFAAYSTLSPRQRDAEKQL